MEKTHPRIPSEVVKGAFWRAGCDLVQIALLAIKSGAELLPKRAVRRADYR